MKIVRVSDAPYLIMGLLPAFFEDFSVDIKSEAVQTVMMTAVRSGQPNYVNPVFTFEGLERRENRFDYKLQLQRNGLLVASSQIPHRIEENHHVIALKAIDMLLRRFLINAARTYEAATAGPPYVLSMILRVQVPLIGEYPAGNVFGEQRTQAVPPPDYKFPYATVDDLAEIDRIIRPFCDQAWQLFGENESRCFRADGIWNGGPV